MLLSNRTSHILIQNLARNKISMKKENFLTWPRSRNIFIIFYRMLTNIYVYQIIRINLKKKNRNFSVHFTNSKEVFRHCRIYVDAVIVDAVQWISGKGEDSGVPSTRNANLIGSWILSSACNYYLRYKSGDLPRLPSSQRATLAGPAVIIRIHTLSRLSWTRLATGSHTDSLRPCTFTQRSRLPPSVNY